MWDAFDDDRMDASGRDRAGQDAGEHCLVKSRFVKTADATARQLLALQVYYIAVPDPRDPPEREPRQLFAADETDLTRKEARAMIWSNRSAKSVCFHRIILSPSTGLGIKTAAEAHAWTRAAMRDLAARLDRDLTWVAGAHTNRDHVHVHVLIAGEAGQPSKGGARRVVRFNASDLKALRERVTVDAAPPIREAARARELDAARARQTARMEDLDRRLGVPLAGQVTGTTPTTTPAPLVAPKRRWWQRRT